MIYDDSMLMRSQLNQQINAVVVKDRYYLAGESFLNEPYVMNKLIVQI